MRAIVAHVGYHAMVPVRVLVLLVALVCISGCSKKDPENPGPNNPDLPSGETRVAPGDRLGWSQPLSDTDIALLQFALYIDGARTVLAGATCTPAGSSYDCSAVLPTMSPGAHTLELASFVIDGSVTAESPRSPALRVVAVTSTTSGFTSQLVTTAEQVQLNLTPVTDRLSLPSDIAFAPDGSIFIAERGGAVRTIRNGELIEAPALDLSSDIRLPEGGLLAIALDPKFEDNGYLYTLLAAAGPRDGNEFIVARYRNVAGGFAERAVLLDRIPASPDRAGGALRIGSDGKIYVGLDNSAEPFVESSFASYNGKVLRLNADATTPEDQPGHTPIFSLEHPQPQALAFQPETGHVWVVDRLGSDDAGRLSAVPKTGRQTRASLRASYALPAGTGAASAAFYRGDAISVFKGNLFLAAQTGRALMRLRFDPEDPAKVASTERLLEDQIGAIRVVAEGPDGALYVATDSSLYKLVP